ncbi:MAG: hypothetical protein RR847_02990 [Bacilli bacterium]
MKEKKKNFKQKSDKNMNDSKIKKNKIKNAKLIIDGKKVSDNSELTRLLLVFAVVTVVFVLFYGLTALFKNRDVPNDTKDKSIAVIQYDEIIVGDIFSQNTDFYYVLVINKKSTDETLYMTYIDKHKEKADKIYQVDLSNIFNKQFVAKDSNLIVENVKDIKFSGNTLLKIENNKLVEYFEGDDEIVDYLNSLSE